MLYQGEVATVAGWFDRLPEPLLHASPLMCVSRAWALALLQRQTRMDELAQALHAAAEALNRPDVAPALAERVTGHIASIQAYLMQTPALADEAPETVIETSQRAQRLLPAGERAIRSVNALGIAHGYAALADLPASEQAFRQAFEEGMAGGNYYAAIYGPINLAGLALAKGQPRQALQLCETNIARFNRLLAGLRFPPIGALHIVKGAIFLEEDRLAEAEQELTHGLSLIRHTGEYEAYVEGHAALARLRCIRGDQAGMAESLGILAETLAGDRLLCGGPAPSSVRVLLANRCVQPGGSAALAGGVRRSASTPCPRWPAWIRCAASIFRPISARPTSGPG